MASAKAIYMAVAVREDATYDSSDGKIKLDYSLGGQLDIMTEHHKHVEFFKV